MSPFSAATPDPGLAPAGSAGQPTGLTVDTDALRRAAAALRTAAAGLEETAVDRRLRVAGAAVAGGLLDRGLDEAAGRWLRRRSTSAEALLDLAARWAASAACYEQAEAAAARGAVRAVPQALG